MPERLQKLISEAGIASRRKAEALILEGRVQVNGVVVTELGTKADPATDHIKVDDKLINPRLDRRELVYVLLNKPRGYLSTTSDPAQRPLAIGLLPADLRRGLHTVGRLDFNTEGLLILTNDGALTDFVARAGLVPKVYHAKVKGHPPAEQIARLRVGISIDGRRTRPAEVELIESTEADNAWYCITLREGRNQQIRKMFDAIGHSVVKLRRVSIGTVTDRGLPVGRWRPLTAEEVRRLMRPPRPTTGQAEPRGGKRPARRLASERTAHPARERQGGRRRQPRRSSATVTLRGD
jgi:23S rRNA pseudouridine2605 synthase